MIVTLTGVAMILLGAFLMAIWSKEDDGEEWFVVGFTIEFLGLLWFLICMILAIIANAYTDKHIKESDMRRESIELQFENAMSNNNTVAQNKAIKAVYEWNEYVFTRKRRVEEPWINWLCDKEWTESLEYIDISTEE